MDNKKKTQKNSKIEYEKLKSMLSDYYEKCSDNAWNLFQDYINIHYIIINNSSFF